jgi:ABC-type glutathione transport system ATPase component
MVDASLRMSIVNLFSHLRDPRAYRSSTLRTTSDANLISDRIIIMRNCRVVEAGDARAVLDNPHIPFHRSSRTPRCPSTTLYEEGPMRTVTSSLARTMSSAPSTLGYSVLSSSISAAVCMAAFLSLGIRRPMNAASAAVCWRWCRTGATIMRYAGGNFVSGYN